MSSCPQAIQYAVSDSGSAGRSAGKSADNPISYPCGVSRAISAAAAVSWLAARLGYFGSVGLRGLPADFGSLIH